MFTSLLFISVCFLAYANGANDNFKGVASLFGSGTVNYRLALIWASLITLAGSMAALFLAHTLLVKFSGKGLAPDEIIHTLPFMTAVAGGAGGTVILATRLGFPISTTHALLGAMAGSTVLATGSIHLVPLLKNFVWPLLLSPFISLILAAALYRIMSYRSFSIPIEDPMCVCIDNKADQLVFTAGENEAMLVDSAMFPALRVDQPEVCARGQAYPILSFDFGRVRDGLHFCSAGAVCFARGLNDTPKIAALLLLIPGIKEPTIITIVALAMLVGGILNARRVAETMSHKITPMSHDQGLSANLVTAFLVVFASKLGMPVSTTHVSAGSLFGIGLVSGQAHKDVIASIALSWLLTLPCAALTASLIYALTSNY